jgi:hypothetical protein
MRKQLCTFYVPVVYSYRITARQLVTIYRLLAGAVAVLAAIVNVSTTSPAATLLKTFTITESFGVSHPDQIIDFDYPNATSLPLSSTCVVGPNGTQVPFQILSSKKIAVRTELPVGASKSWQLMSSCTPTATAYPDEVVVDTSNQDYIQLTNSLTGVRVFNYHGQTRRIPIASVSMTNNRAVVTTAVANHFETLNADNVDGRVPQSEPYMLGKSDLAVAISGLTGACSYLNGSWHINNTSYWDPSATQFVLTRATGADCSDTSGGTATVSETEYAPIQGIMLKDGSWSPSGSKLITVNGYQRFAYKWMYASNVTATFLERGPLQTVVQVSYSYIPFQLSISNENRNSEDACARYGRTAPCATPVETGYYTSTIKLEAGQPSIQIEEDTNKDFRYSITNMYEQIRPDQGRYRGHFSNNYTQGHHQNGTVCAKPPQEDCFREFDYSNAITASYITNDTSSIAYAQAWNLWSNGTGYYWMLYNKSAGASAPVIGAYLGAASRTIGGNATGFSPYFVPGDSSNRRSAGFEFITTRRGADASIFLRSRYSWGIFVGTKGDDLAAPAVTQKINRQLNLHGGFNLNKVYRYILNFADPVKGYGGLFNDPSMVQGTISKLRSNRTRGSAYSNSYLRYLYGTEPSARPLYDLWADVTGEKTHAAVVRVQNLARSMLNAFINGNGIYEFDYGYWHGGVRMYRELPVLDSILADPLLTSADKVAAKAVASLFGYILYDNDFVPLDMFGSSATDNGLNAGTANMPLQQQGYRYNYTLFIPQHPFLQQFVENVVKLTDQSFQLAINQYGASGASPHYTGAAVEPILHAMLQAKMAGTDLFVDNPRATRFGEFLMQLSTPPEVRYLIPANTYGVRYPANNVIPRKMIAEGDGSTEGTDMTGVLAQGFRDANPTLARRLMGAWVQGGKSHGGFFTTSVAIINENAPSVDPKLGNDTFLGYMSVLRSGWGTDKENAAWILNGDWLSSTGHRHDDRGAIMLYALKAPLTINWGSMYNPQVGGGNMASMVLPETSYSTIRWNGDNQPLNSIFSNWQTSSNNTFESFAQSSMANAIMIDRNGLQWERKLYSIVPNADLPMIMVKDNFSELTQSKVMTINLMATGVVSTPAGPITPTVRLSANTQTATVLPSVSPTIRLNAGVNKFMFTGQTWTQHPTRGIDWDLYTIAGEPQQAVIGNWGHSWNPTPEMAQFQVANRRIFAESQHILRVHGNGSFWTLILPYHKGARPSDLTVTLDEVSNSVIITRLTEAIRVNEHYYSFTDGRKSILTSFDSNTAIGNNISISGGAMEIVLSGDTATLTFSGATGMRIFTLPGSWNLAKGVAQNGASYTYNYAGGNVTIVLSTPRMTAPPVPE